MEEKELPISINSVYIKTLVLGAEVKYATLAFGDEPPRMLKIIQFFGKYCCCLLHGACA
jgi:hypothetical protein